MLTRFVKKLLFPGSLFCIPVLFAGLCAIPFQETVSFYYDFFGLYLVLFGLLYLVLGLIIRKWRKLLLLTGTVLFIIGAVLFSVFYGYFYYTNPDMSGDFYYDLILFQIQI